jgi:hypothetical protein
MTMKMKMGTWAALALLSFPPDARAQEQAETKEPRRGVTPLKVQIVFSKYQGEKKVASLPYTLTCNSDRNPAMLRMGIEVPVPVAFAKEGAPSFQYKNVGTNIDCRAGAIEDGRFRLELSIEQSSLYSVGEDKVRRAGATEGEGRPGWGVTDTPLGGAPMFRNFRSTFVPILRDGQTVQYTTATDPVSGEVVKIDVTLTVLK